MRTKWSAKWISHPTAPLRDPVTLHFRRTFQADHPGKTFLVHVSADNRFVLYLNGHRVGDGPARGDLNHWRYETFDLRPLIVTGPNTLSATVWNLGVYAPTAQMSDRTAFLVEGDSPAEAVVNTDDSWMVETEPGQIAYPHDSRVTWDYFAIGSGEQLLASQYDWAWQTENTDGGRWVHAASAMRDNIYPGAAVASSRGTLANNPWQLVPGTLPARSYRPEDVGHVVRSDVPGSAQFPARPLEIPAHVHVHVLLDRQSLTTAYPRLSFSGGEGSRIELTYAEALYDTERHKGDRNEVGTRQPLGPRDLILPDGGNQRTFEPLWWRTWRYLDLDITTEAKPVRLDSFTAAYTAYPFEQVGSFHSDDAELNEIWKIGWHTLELDAHETYMDTPFYEQLQYVGDTRIEALITYVVSGDDRLPRQALRAFDDSRTPDGLTASRYPSSLAQSIPPFSLLWIGMVDDFAQYHADRTLIREMLPGTRTVLNWFMGDQAPDGLIRKPVYWDFVDWTAEGTVLPTYDQAGESCLLTLQYVGALESAERLEAENGEMKQAQVYQARRKLAEDGLKSRCWDPTKRLMADSSDRTIFSQQSNILAVLYDVIPADQQADLLNRTVLSEADISSFGTSVRLIPATYYFRFYMARALAHAGLADRYLASLKPWRDLLPLHFSTWPEIPGNTRSDSHAWTAHPTYDLLTLVAGIAPGSSGFKTVRIEPHLGALHHLEAAMAHERGTIRVFYTLEGGRLQASVFLPGGLTGDFVWRGKSRPLHGGQNELTLSQ